MKKLVNPSFDGEVGSIAPTAIDRSKRRRSPAAPQYALCIKRTGRHMTQKKWGSQAIGKLH